MTRLVNCINETEELAFQTQRK